MQGLLFYRDTCLKLLNNGASQSGEPPQGTGTPSKPRDVKSLTKSTAGPSGLTEQGASIEKPTEEDIVVQKLPPARTTISGATRRRLKKAQVGQSGTWSLMQLGHKTPESILLRNPGLLCSLGRIRKLFSTLGHLSSKTILRRSRLWKTSIWSWPKVGRCFARPQMGDAHFSDPTGWLIAALHGFQIREGAGLKVTDAKHLPKPVKMALKMKNKVVTGHEELLKWIKSLNLGLHTEDWTFLIPMSQLAGLSF
jgi:hypothetical protein